jgi:hypothetical protein
MAYANKQSYVAAERAANTSVVSAFTLDINAANISAHPFYASAQIGDLVTDSLTDYNIANP